MRPCPSPEPTPTAAHLVAEDGRVRVGAGDHVDELVRVRVRVRVRVQVRVRVRSPNPNPNPPNPNPNLGGHVSPQRGHRLVRVRVLGC